MSDAPKRLKIAFVYPPYGPPNLANLGIAVLAGGVEQRGFHTRTFYWNYRLTQALDVADDTVRTAVYSQLTQRELFPWNEWVFIRTVYPDRLEPQIPQVLKRLEELDRRANTTDPALLPSRIILGLAAKVPALLDEMAAELEPYDVIGITTTFFQNGPALALAKHVKDRWPHKRVVLGGANCDGDMGPAVAEHFPFVDYVFSGEADLSFPEFVERLEAGSDVTGLPGLIHRDAAGQVVCGPPSQPVTDMNALPIPVFGDFIAERKKYGLYDHDTLVLPLESSRGCWWGAKHHCIFCGLNANGITYRHKDAERFQEEVRHIARTYDVKYLFMADNILSTRYYQSFVAWAKENGLNLNLFYEIKANMNRAQVAALSDAGITMVQPGIESLSTPVLKLMNKGIRGIQNIAFLKYAREYGIVPAWNVLAGFPGEDPFEYQKMARDVGKLTHLSPPNAVIDIEFHRFSPLYRDPERFGIRLVPHHNYSFLYPFPPEEVARHAYVFEVAGRGPHDLSYLRKLSQEVQDWVTAFRSGKTVLSWERQGDGILVRDRRDPRRGADYRLSGFAAQVLRACDGPTRIDTLLDAGGDAEEDEASPYPIAPGRRWAGSGDTFRIVPASAPETPIAFTREDFAQDPRGTLAPLLDAGLLYEEDGLLLALPTHVSARPFNPGWKLIGI